MPTGIKVKDAMVSRVVTATSDQTILSASQIMKNEDIGSLVIIDRNVPIGIVTREDIINKVSAEDLLPSKVTIQDIMSNSLVTVMPDEDISTAAKLMSKHMYERIPVVFSGKLVGIISTREIARVAPAALEVMTEHLRIEEPHNFEASQAGECQKCGNFSDDLRNSDGAWVCDTCAEETEA